MKLKRNKLNDRIYIQQWLELKPYDKQVSTDFYYLKLSNEVKNAIITNKQSFVLLIYLDAEKINILSCFLTSYFEDIISGTNIWNTFVKQHTELYHKPLPFFNIEEYYEEEVNLQDVCFLIWYFLNTIQRDKFIAPFNNFIFETATKVYDVFDAAWDYAPENETLKTFYTLGYKETDFYKARNLIDTILFKTYLFYPDTLLDLRDAEMEIVEEDGYNENLVSLLNENRDYSLHNAHTRILSLNGKEWVSKILGKNHPLYNDYQNISRKIQGSFLYKGQDDKDIFIEHIASGKKFNLTKKSFDHSNALNEIDTFLYIGIVQWCDEWWFSGVYFQTEFNADLVLDEKKSIESRMVVDFLDHREKNVDEFLKKQFNAFMDFTNGSEITFIESDRIDDFIRSYTEYFNNTLKLSKKERGKARERAKAEGYLGSNEESNDFSDVSESGLIFFNPKSGVEIALAVNSAFPLPGNPFFNKEESEEHILRLLMNEDISKELAMYCIDNFQSELPFFKGKEGKMYLADIDFLLRFWKKDNYFTKPSITFTGNSKETDNE